MKLATLAALTSLTVAAADLKPSSAEVDQARQYLKQTQDEVIGATKGLTDAQWKFKTAPDRWSISEILEHMVLAQDLILGPVSKQLSAASAPGTRDTKAVDLAIISKLPDRSAKFKAPEVLEPTGRVTPKEGLERLRQNYARLNDALDAPDLRAHSIEAAPLKAVSKGEYDTMDGYQWILAAAAHTERHVKQMLEVKADAHFPAK